MTMDEVVALDLPNDAKARIIDTAHNCLARYGTPLETGLRITYNAITIEYCR